ncbi:MAG TPA: hypothetical protein VL285_11910 [Bryobacteraceae bacterium]|jgi:flagellar protein FlgJ|nr:hypothetical protein [Bryobacteraceae bacterium]
MMDGVSLKPAGAAPPSGAPENLKLKDAAGKFEALLIAQMLKSARETDGGGEADQTGAAVLDIADQHLAEMLGSQGALGIARMVVEKLG